MVFYIHLDPIEAQANRDSAKEIHDQLDQHALSLGQLCMAWATLDGLIEALFEPLLACTPLQVSSILTNMDSIPSKCEVAKRLITNELPAGEYRDWVIAILARIVSEIAPLRNRYVHDHWEISQDGTVRIDKRAKIGKPQAHQATTLTFNSKHVAAPGEVDALRDKIGLMIVIISDVGRNLRAWRHRGLPPVRDPQYREAHKPNARWMNLQEHLKALEQGRSTLDLVFD
jgi:hypothetical protein